MNIIRFIETLCFNDAFSKDKEMENLEYKLDDIESITKYITEIQHIQRKIEYNLKIIKELNNIKNDSCIENDLFNKYYQDIPYNTSKLKQLSIDFGNITIKIENSGDYFLRNSNDLDIKDNDNTVLNSIMECLTSVMKDENSNHKEKIIKLMRGDIN